MCLVYVFGASSVFTLQQLFVLVLASAATQHDRLNLWLMCMVFVKVCLKHYMSLFNMFSLQKLMDPN